MKKLMLFLLTAQSILLACNNNTIEQSEKKYKIEAKHSGKYLTLSYNRTLQTISDTTDAYFKWQFKLYADSTAQIISVPSGESIEVAAVKDQVLPYITKADSTNMRQRFRLIKDRSGSVYLQSAYSNYCIDVSESDRSDFPVITTWPKENQPNQKWKINTSGDEITLASDLNGKFLAATPPTGETGANIGQWPFVNRSEQIWTLQQLKNGAYTFRNNYSNMYLQLSDGKLSLKYNVHQSPDSITANSHWFLDSAKNGYVKFRNAASGLCMDVRDGVSYDGANVMAYDCKGAGDNQFWKLIEIDEAK